MLCSTSKVAPLALTSLSGWASVNMQFIFSLLKVEGFWLNAFKCQQTPASDCGSVFSSSSVESCFITTVEFFFPARFKRCILQFIADIWHHLPTLETVHQLGQVHTAEKIKNSSGFGSHHPPPPLETFLNSQPTVYHFRLINTRITQRASSSPNRALLRSARGHVWGKMNESELTQNSQFAAMCHGERQHDVQQREGHGLKQSKLLRF